MAEGSFYLASRLQLDPDYIGGGTFALLAKKGWGKTYAMRVMAEQFAKTHVPFVALDPMDAFWGLRSSKDGKANGGLSIPIFGGEHADVPLEPTAGALMADLVVKEGLSMVLSIAHFGSRAAERRFAMDFLDRLYRTNRNLVHLLIDEADLFAPQKPQAGDQPLLGVTENIVRRGRNKGIGITLGTQRPAVLNKDVLTQVDGIIVGRMLGPNDRNAIDNWVGEHGSTSEGKAIKDELPHLATGECWVWIPEEGVLKKVTIRKARTFDSSPTQKRTATRSGSLSLADIDLTGIADKVAATVEKAKAEDPKELRKRIRELEATVSKLETEQPTTEPEEIEIPILDDDMAREVRESADDVIEATNHLLKAAGRVESSVGKAEGLVAKRSPQNIPRSNPVSRQTAGPPAKPNTQRSREDIPSDLTGPQQRVLDSIAWWNQIGFPRPTKLQVGFIAGYRVGKKIGGTYGNLLGALRSMGLIDYPTSGAVELTAEGQQKAQAIEIEQSVAGLQAAIMEHLAGPERRVLQATINVYPESAPKQEIGAAAGYNVSDKIGGTFGNILGRLRSLGLIDYPSPGEVAAEPILFLEG